MLMGHDGDVMQLRSRRCLYSAVFSDTHKVRLSGLFLPIVSLPLLLLVAVCDPLQLLQIGTDCAMRESTL